ncbi:hypothetical protein M2459_001662 [Parabacteroides sp. PF5-5]|nr:hypothetical protein [Parabacteroides sp. PH5-39]MDH6315989.1 hypothetical protein [Parabacteroides sp. PF5-13]MDH6319646.1 hypothetical protein [Parabacteroides sp. PH5-13]MDH6323377.1 hypothetical protein [Parabacteroides sp. PH5-8]MDH6327114.1 hypothetical protein [Parabacteroides sp. PH5-41]MDH6334916.1 hypothetical protein [Parabacteroides sp. PF5-5]MDH6345980.1 hypothetical protein [Parabacteroides sp. PH5-46]MDH6361002.1 hypothetical protein [Parabacteroides sp. PH5-16]MDH6376669.
MQRYSFLYILQIIQNKYSVNSCCRKYIRKHNKKATLLPDFKQITPSISPITFCCRQLSASLPIVIGNIVDNYQQNC